MTVVTTPQHLLDEAKHRLLPTISTTPGMAALENWLLNREWKQIMLAEPPPGSGLKPVIGDAGLPVLGHLIELFRGGPDYVLRLFQTQGPLIYLHHSPAPAVFAIGPNATQAIFTNRNKDFSQRGWDPVIGPFFKRGLTLLDFDEHRRHRRIMQQAFTHARLTDYVAQIDQVVTKVVAEEWVADDARFLLHPAMKALAFDIASVVFMGRGPGADHKQIAKVHRAFAATTSAGEAILRFPVPPFKWWRGLRGRDALEQYFAVAVQERRGADGADILTVLCQAEDGDGNRFTDADIVNHMIFLMMAADDAATSAVTAMAYRLATHPEWQERARDESACIGDGPLDIEALEKLETLDLVMNESLRLDTPLPFSVRQAVRDTELFGHYLPAGINVVTWPSVNHRLPELWTDPEKFDPDRFGDARAEHKRHRYAFAPWGGGAHKCIGMTFGQLEIKAVMHRVLRFYRLELPHPNYRARWDYGGVPVPTDGMPIVLRSLRR
jgi:cytochrome P450